MNYTQYSRTIGKLPVSPVYLLSGNDSYLIGLSADAIYNKTSKRVTGEVEKHRFYADSTPARQALSPLEGMGFFSSSSVVIIHNIDKYNSSDTALLASYISRPNPECTLVLTAKSVDKRKSLYKKMQKAQVTLIEFKAAREEEMADWIQAIARQKGKTITRDAVSILIEKTGNDLGKASMEIKKLAAFAGDAQRIEGRHVEDLVGRSRVNSAFDLSNAVSQRNTSKALSVLATLFREGESEIGMLALLRWQFLRILRAKDLELRGTRRDEIPAALGVRYFQREFLDMLRGFDYPSAEKAYLALFDADVALRGGKELNNRCVFENLVITLCAM